MPKGYSHDAGSCSAIIRSLGDSLVGSILAERYRIDSLLGEGAMGRVYLGQHVVLKNKLAIKVLLAEMSTQEEIVKRFEREAHAAGNLSHPNIARATDFGRAPDGRIFLVLEYVPGRSLQKVNAETGALAPERACKIARQILSALVHAHGKGIVHRDLKPENVILVERPDLVEKDIVKILDFGIAKVTNPDAADGVPLTKLGLVYGTPEYLSPEQALGRAVDHRADLYAVGVMLYEMLVGRRPFDAPEQITLLLAHANQEPPPPSQFGPVAPALEAFVLTLLQKAPEHRYADARAALDALDLAGGGKQPSAPPSRPPVDARAQTVAMPTQKPTSAGRRAVRSAVDRARAFYRQSPERALATVGGALLLLVGLMIAIGSGEPEAPARAAVSPGAPPLAATDSEETSAEAPPASSGRSTAELRAVLEANPDDAQAHREMGAAWARARDLAQSVLHYGEALRLDPSLRADPILQDHLVDALSSPRVWTEAKRLLEQSVGEAGLGALQKGAVEDHRMRVRARTREIMTAIGASNPSWVEAAFALDDARSCEDRSAAIAQIRSIADPRLLGPLHRRQRDKRRADRDCDPMELTAAIAMLGG